MKSHFDLVVMGAGTTGTAVAARAARQGLSVCLLERHALDAAGACWVNDIPGWMFDEGDLAKPSAEEQELPAGTTSIPPDGFRMLMYAGYKPPALQLDSLRWCAVDMRVLGKRLHQSALQAGVVVRAGVHVQRVEPHRLQTNLGELRAKFLVDASGSAGVNALHLPSIAREEYCVAAQEVCEIADAEQAEAYFAPHGLKHGDTLVYSGVHGGYSVINLRLLGDRVSMLAGTVPAQGHPSGASVLEQFRKSHRWVGKRKYGGGRAIPLPPPLYPFANASIAHVGDAARQVFAAHGSGTGSGIVAARMLVDALVDGGGPTAYMTRWMRTYGALHFTYDLVRRFTQTLTIPEVALLIEGGLMHQESVRAGVEQRLPALSSDGALGTLRGALRAPRLAARAARFLSIAPALSAVAKTFPSEPRAQARSFKALRAMYATLPKH